MTVDRVSVNKKFEPFKKKLKAEVFAVKDG
jgi:hypothetical protein